MSIFLSHLLLVLVLSVFAFNFLLLSLVCSNLALNASSIPLLVEAIVCQDFITRIRSRLRLKISTA